jgi:hypothetical protein
MDFIDSNNKDDNHGLPWSECCICGSLSYRGLAYFTDGSVEPQVGETLTGGTSKRTGVVEQVFKTTGTWAGGDAEGVVQMTTPAGYDSMYLILFTDGETVTGSLGASFVEDGDGSVLVSGKQYSRNQVVVYNGKQYCRPHFEYMWRKRLISDSHIDINEDIRNLPWS